MNFQWNIETFILLVFIVLSLLGSLLIIRLDWKRYGLLYILSAAVGNILCYLFVKLGFYTFPFRLFPAVSVMPFEAIVTVFPFYVLLGVRYSPKSWAYKIPFYWVIIHLGMLGETVFQLYTDLINYNFEWDFWDSYTWWWIYLLFFEWLGGRIIPSHLRKPISAESFRYGNWFWLVLHFVLILTIFLGGLYLGTLIT